jgi:diguanylate cyclase (GGDEF)-like protein/PAS domain S-box-containing protein
VPDVDKLSKIAPKEKQAWKKIGYKSLLLVPLTTHGKRSGFICFDSFTEKKNWQEDELKLLNIIGGLINQALERKDIMQIMMKNEEKFKTIFNGTIDGIMVVDKDRNIIDWNRGAEDITGYAKKEALGQKCFNIFSGNDKTCSQANACKNCQMLKAFKLSKAFETSGIDVYLCDKRGKKVYIRLIVMPIFNPYDEVIGGIELFSDITPQTLKAEQLEYQANYDTLTGLRNRRAFNRMLPIECERAKRYKRKLTSLFIDIDDFKKYNDDHGHKEGDKLLNILGKLLLENIRMPDYAYRYGGEEFVILLPETKIKTAIELAERIRKLFANMKFKPEDNRHKVHKTISIGISEYNPNLPPFEFISQSDEAMYIAKKNGKNQVCTYKD